MTDHLHALAMRTKAVAAIDAAGDNDELGGSYNTFEAYGAGLWVAMEVVAALPLEADHAALLAEAVKMPEIAQLIRDVAEGPMLGSLMTSWINERMKQAAALLAKQKP